jgi:hypothetical protein
MHEAIVVDVHRDDVARYLRRDRDGVAVGVGVVGADLIARQEPPDECADRQDDDHDAQNDERLLAGLFGGLLFVVAVVFLFVVLRIFIGCIAVRRRALAFARVVLGIGVVSI